MPSCSSVARTERPDERIVLDSWVDRLIAWLIDFIIISIGLAILFVLISLPFWLLDATNFARLYNSVEPLHYVITSSVYTKTAAIESFGKAFLLLLDVILGWIFTDDKRQRIFNRASKTIIIKLKQDYDISNNVKYRKD